MSGCQYELLELHQEYDKNGHLFGTRVKPAGLCPNLPVKGTNWCDEHAYVHEMLQAAAVAGCPEMVIATVYAWGTKRQEPVLTVGNGLDSWEAYAQRHQLSRHDSVMGQLARIKERQKLDDQDAIKRAVAKASKNAA